MRRNQRTNGVNMPLPNAGAVLEAQFNVAENVTRLTGTAYHYAMSINRTWLNLWSNQFTHMTELPRRMAHVQREMVEETLDEFQEGMQELGQLTLRAKDEAEGSMRETMDEADEAGREAPSQQRAGSNGDREHGMHPNSAGDRRRGERKDAHRAAPLNERRQAR